MSIKYASLFLIVIFLFAVFFFSVYAQEEVGKRFSSEQNLNGEIDIFDNELVDYSYPETLAPQKIYDEPLIERDDHSILGSGEIIYDVYGRLEYVGGDWPFGLTVRSDYEYYYEDQHIGNGYYEPIIKRESGSMKIRNTYLVRYDVTFDKKGNVISKDSSGADNLRRVMRLIVPLIGVENFNQEDADRWISERFK